jgi:hypothetical protein
MGAFRCKSKNFLITATQADLFAISIHFCKVVAAKIYFLNAARYFDPPVFTHGKGYTICDSLATCLLIEKF